MQFGFDGDNKWMKRRDDLFSILHSNPKAKFVTRAVQFGSETLYDHALNPETLVAQIKSAKDQLASLHISVTVSDLAYSFRDVSLHALFFRKCLPDMSKYIESYTAPKERKSSKP
ncbi:hypothetical protein H0H93_001035 [Arthromyces matolae]|nr:hypothetical protein H0H93_001035 [Arthromyces matolae]